MQEAGKSRYDFNTEEEGELYKNAKEAAPKAAFQFGLKNKDGRKAHKDLGKQNNAKINTQLGKIKGILEEKVGTAIDVANIDKKGCQLLADKGCLDGEDRCFPFGETKGRQVAAGKVRAWHVRESTG